MITGGRPSTPENPKCQYVNECCHAGGRLWRHTSTERPTSWPLKTQTRSQFKFLLQAACPSFRLPGEGKACSGNHTKQGRESHRVKCLKSRRVNDIFGCKQANVVGYFHKYEIQSFTSLVTLYSIISRSCHVHTFLSRAPKRIIVVIAKWKSVLLLLILEYGDH